MGNVDVIPPGLNTISSREIHELTKQNIVGRQTLNKLFCRSFTLQSLAVGVYIVEGELLKKSGICYINIIRRYARSVVRHENIRHNAPASIYFPSVESCELQRFIKLDGIKTEHLSAVVAVDNIMAVEGTIGVILLNAAPRGRIITANGKTYGGTVGKHRLALYEPLAERTASDNQSAVVVLKRTCENLRRRSGELIE